MAFLTLLCCYSCSDLGFLTVSSIDKIVQAAYVAAFNALILTSSGSQTNVSKLFPTPVLISTPKYIFSTPPLAKYKKN
jgi:hypothetical protein